MIKTIRLGTVIFYLLIFAVVIAALIILLTTDKSELNSVFTTGNPNSTVLVIDAGHGGEDGGAVSVSGVNESEINLDIALKMASLSELTGINYALTRSSNEISYPDSAKTVASRKKHDLKTRAEFINKYPDAVLISVHQNCYPHSSPFGPQSFYSKNEGSDDLAVLIQAYMNTSLSPGNRRIAMPVAKNIYLFKNVDCTAVLVECGFISNSKEAKLLDTEEYRLKIAAILTSAYLQYLDTKE